MTRIVNGFPKTIILFTFLLIILGGIVHNTESSLACPDWPLCFGQVMPKMEGGILIEHSHRLLGSLVGFLTLIFFVITYFSKRFELKTLRPLAGFALFLVIIQGILGGITVIYKLPTIVSSSHLGLAMIFFLLVNLIDFKFCRSLVNQSSIDHSNPRIIANAFEFTALLLAATYLQIIFGAFMRHSGSGAACGLGASSALLCLDVSNNNLMLWPTAVTSQVHMLHRLGGLFIALLSIGFTIWSISNAKYCNQVVKGKFNSFAIVLIGAVFLQMLLGVATVVDFIGPIPTTLHLAGAAILLVILWRHFLMLKEELANFTNLSNSFFRDLFEMSKPKLTLLVVVTTFTGILLTPHELHPIQVLLVLIAMFLVVAGAAILNCYMERHIDAKMERTKLRPLPNNRFSPYLALTTGLMLNLVGTVMLYWQSNLMTAILALLASCIYLLAYTPLKQNSAMALFVGALPGAMPSLIGWTAMTNELGIIPISLVLTMILWQIPHFMAIAVRYSQDYHNAGLIVFPNHLGTKPSIIIAVLTSVILLIVSMGPYFLGNFSLVYAYAAAFLGGAFLIFNFVWMLQRTNSAIQLGAKGVFWASIAYLPLLFACMIFFK